MQNNETAIFPATSERPSGVRGFGCDVTLAARFLSATSQHSGGMGPQFWKPPQVSHARPTGVRAPQNCNWNGDSS